MWTGSLVDKNAPVHICVCYNVRKFHSREMMSECTRSVKINEVPLYLYTMHTHSHSDEHTYASARTHVHPRTDP